MPNNVHVRTDSKDLKIESSRLQTATGQMQNRTNPAQAPRGYTFLRSRQECKNRIFDLCYGGGYVPVVIGNENNVGYKADTACCRKDMS